MDGWMEDDDEFRRFIDKKNKKRTTRNEEGRTEGDMMNLREHIVLDQKEEEEDTMDHMNKDRIECMRNCYRSRPLTIGLLIVAVILTGTANSFAGKIRADAYGDDDFIVVVYDSIASFIFYSICLVLCMNRGYVTAEQIKNLFACGDRRRWDSVGGFKWLIVAGISDSIDMVTGFAAQPPVSSLVMSLMNQATTPFTVVVSMIVLRTRYWWTEIAGVAIMLGGATMCVLLKKSDGDDESSTFWAIFAALTTFFAAVSYVLKEKTFNEFRDITSAAVDRSEDTDKRRLVTPILGGTAEASRTRAPRDSQLSVFLLGFVVSSVGLVFSIPVALLNQAITTSDPVVPAFSRAIRCISECENGLDTYVIYIAINLAFNLAILALTSYASALLAFLSLKMCVPLVAILSPIPFPLIGSQSVTAGQWGSLVVMGVGLVLFRYYNMRRIAASV